MSLGSSVAVVVEQLRRPVPGGIGTYARGLLRGLTELAEEAPAITIVASRPSELPDPLAEFDQPLVTLPVSSFVLSRAWSLGAFALRGYTVVHSTALDVPPSTAPLVVTVHDLLWRELPEAYGRHGRRWHEAALRRAGRRASAFVVPSVSVRDALAEALQGAAPREIAVIEEGADHLPPPDPAATRALLERLGVTGEYLLAVGTLEPRKNLERLIAAYAQVRERLCGQPSLVICGPEGWGSIALSDTVGVVLTGWVEGPTLAGLYGGALAYAHLSLGEGFGLPVVEAMAAGVPVVAGNVPAAGEAALHVDPRDVGAIGEALVALTSDQALRTRLIEAGARRVESLSWRRCAAEHVSLWDAVAEPR